MALKEYDYLFKVLLIGGSASHKTALLYRMVGDTMPEARWPAGVGIDFKIRQIEIDEKVFQFICPTATGPK